MPPGPAPIPASSSTPRINDWHTCPAGGEIRASNPCSEYMFLDDTACNLASLNLMRSARATASRPSTSKRFEHAVRLWTIVLEISVLMAQFPSKEIAQLSYDYRTLGLGFANIGGLLMSAGIPYDSREGRAIAGAIAARDDRRLLCHQRRNGGRAGRLPRICRQQGRHAAGDPQSSPRRPWRSRGL